MYFLCIQYLSHVLTNQGQWIIKGELKLFYGWIIALHNPCLLAPNVCVMS